MMITTFRRSVLFWSSKVQSNVGKKYHHFHRLRTIYQTQSRDLVYQNSKVRLQPKTPTPALVYQVPFVASKVRLPFKRNLGTST